MSKRSAEAEPEETRETKRLKLETHDTRPANVQVWMKQSLVGSKIAPFLRTTEVNNLLLTCKLQRENLDTNPNAWSPALQIARTRRLPYISTSFDSVARFVQKISPNLRAVDINLEDWSTPSGNLNAIVNYIAIKTAKQPLDVMRITTAAPYSAKLDVENWHLYARKMVFRGVSFNHETDSDAEEDEDIDFDTPKYATEMDVTLQEYHRHVPFLDTSPSISTLVIDATSNGQGEYKCRYCACSFLASSCFPTVDHVAHLRIKLDKQWTYEVKTRPLWLRWLVDRMPALQTLELSGKTDRSRDWFVECIAQTLHAKSGTPLQVDYSKLEVPKAVEVQYEPFVVVAK